MEEGARSPSKISLTVNLSSLQLSETDISLLNKGLTFVPSPELIPTWEILGDRNKLIRNLKLRDFFDNKNHPRCSRIDPTVFIKTREFDGPSTWEPRDNQISVDTRNTCSEIIAETDNLLKSFPLIKTKFGRHLKIKGKHNLTKQECDRLRVLGRDKNIIIKKADKGGAIVIMDVCNYRIEALRQLNDPIYYKKLKSPIFKDTAIKIKRILMDMKFRGVISEKQFTFLSGPERPRHRIFYLLPKIHKPVEKWTLPHKMPEGRPIVSDINSETYRISKYIESILTPLSIKHKSYLKDTYDFIHKIRGLRVPDHTLIVTGDVSALYTNMTHDRTISTVSNILQTYPEVGRPDTYIIQLLEIILRSNDFCFDGNFYLQTCGTPMGKVMAPALANIYLLEFDEQARRFAGNNLLFFFRYLDDIIFAWIGSRQELDNFGAFLNQLIPGIKVTLDISDVSSNFLDTTVFISKSDQGSSLNTKVFFKATDTHQLLHSESFHPKHVSKGVLKSQLIRFKRISSSFKDYTNTCRILFKSLGNRGYSWTCMWKMMKEIWFTYNTSINRKNRKRTFETAFGDTGEKLLPIITKFDGFGVKYTKLIRNIIRKNRHFDKYRLVNAYAKHPNLAQKLIRSELRKPVFPEPVNPLEATKKLLKRDPKAAGLLGIKIQRI